MSRSTGAPEALSEDCDQPAAMQFAWVMSALLHAHIPATAAAAALPWHTGQRGAVEAQGGHASLRQAREHTLQVKERLE